MKKVKLLLLLLLFSCNVNKKTISDVSNKEIEQKSSNAESFDTPCAKTFYSINNKETIIKGQLFLYNQKAEIKKILNCSFILAKQGNHKAERFILDLFNEFDSRLENKNVNPREIYNLALISESITNKNSFELLMKYFSIYLKNFNFRVDPRHNDSGYEFGYSTYSLLLNMMNKESKKFYQKLHDDMVLDFALNENNNMILLYSRIYPLLKADWEAGKIKLRESPKESE